jgi:hypothetical protein
MRIESGDLGHQTRTFGRPIIDTNQDGCNTYCRLYRSVYGREAIITRPCLEETIGDSRCANET